MFILFIIIIISLSIIIIITGQVSLAGFREVTAQQQNQERVTSVNGSIMDGNRRVIHLKYDRDLFGEK
jgi:hypothetical protein